MTSATAINTMFLATYGEMVSAQSIDDIETLIRACNPETAFSDLDERDRVMALNGEAFLEAMGVEWEELSPTDDPNIWVAERHRTEPTRYRCVGGAAEALDG